MRHIMLNADTEKALVDSLAYMYLYKPETELATHQVARIKKFINDELAKVPLEATVVDYEPYSSHEDMFADMRTGSFKVSGLNNNAHPYFTENENIMFRILHDYHHFILSADFSFAGEFKTWQHIAGLTSDELIKQFLFSEIVLQAAVYFSTGEFAQTQRVVL